MSTFRKQLDTIPVYIKGIKISFNSFCDFVFFFRIQQNRSCMLAKNYKTDHQTFKIYFSRVWYKSIEF